MANAKDPKSALKTKAASYPDVIIGTSCTQDSFKIGKKAFLYIGEQGGRSKAMFKLEDSLESVEQLAADAPDDFQVGGFGWVTVRFSAAKPIPKKLWSLWLEESYRLSLPKSAASKKAKSKTTKKKKPAAKSSKKTASQKTSSKSSSIKKTAAKTRKKR